MSVVVDANLVAAIILPLPYSEASRRRMTAWKKAGETVTAPTLWEYELVSALRRLIQHGLLSAVQAREALLQVSILGVQSIPPSEALHQNALAWAERLGQARAYDAQYLALADQQRAVLWTGDQCLSNGAQALGLGWVRWVGES